MSMDRVLVTGADGFIGSHLTEMLVERGKKVRALCMYNSFNFWGWLEDSPVKGRVEIVTGDVRDAHFCERITKDIDVVYNLAALIAIPYSYEAPDSYVDTNVKGALNICQAAMKNGCKQVIHTSTSEVYGTAQYVPIDEKHPLQPQSPYSATKIGADAMAMSFYHAFNLPVTIARPFNTYGPRQSARAIIPTVISQIAAKLDRLAVGLNQIAPYNDTNTLTGKYPGDLVPGIYNGLLEPDATANVGALTAPNAAAGRDIAGFDRAALSPRGAKEFRKTSGAFTYAQVADLAINAVNDTPGTGVNVFHFQYRANPGDTGSLVDVYLSMDVAA